MLFRKWSVRAEPHSRGSEFDANALCHLPLVDAVPAELGRVHGNEGVNRRGLGVPSADLVDPVDLRVVEVDRASDVGLERTT